MDRYGRTATILRCPRCKTEVPGNGLRCPKCGPILSHLGRGTESASHVDFTRDFIVIRGAFYLIVSLTLMSMGGWHVYAPAFGVAFLLDPWRSAHRRGSLARGLRYTIGGAILLGFAFTLGLSLEDLQRLDYARISASWSTKYAEQMLIMLSYCLFSGGIMMWILAAAMPKR